MSEIEHSKEERMRSLRAIVERMKNAGMETVTPVRVIEHKHKAVN